MFVYDCFSLLPCQASITFPSIATLNLLPLFYRLLLQLYPGQVTILILPCTYNFYFISASQLSVFVPCTCPTPKTP